MRGENMYMRWECVLEVGTRWLWVVERAHMVRICTWGENVYARWECVCEVTLNGVGGHARWGYVCEVRMCTRGENMRMKWLWGEEGTTLHRGPKVTSRPCEVTFLYSIDVTSMMTKLQMMKIPRVWLYIVQSHLMYLAHVHEVTLRGGGEHARWECMRDENCHTRWEWSWMWDENCHVRWEWSCEMRIATWGGNGHIRWELPYEMRIATRGGNGHARWELPRKVGMVTRDENCHMRWEWSCEVRMVMRDENCHMRWEWSREMRIAMWGGNGHARYEPPSEILHSLIFMCYWPRETDFIGQIVRSLVIFFFTMLWLVWCTCVVWLQVSVIIDAVLRYRGLFNLNTSFEY